MSNIYGKNEIVLPMSVFESVIQTEKITIENKEMSLYEALKDNHLFVANEVWSDSKEIGLMSKENKPILAIVSMEEYVKMKEEIAQLKKDLSLGKT